jgi:SAM-dependent methyltransferase
MLNKLLQKISNNKFGVEIGGPSSTGQIIYENSNNIDNVIFSKTTIWSNHTDEYNYYPGKQGKVIISDAVNIPVIENETYDFCFSSHCLEHIANPLKGLNEWLRIVKNDGYIILILPEKSRCFDHRRDISSFSKLVKQYENNVDESDLSTLSEILEKHDLSMDGCAGTFENFVKRSLDNFNNRCLHHYVYDTNLLKTICNYFNCRFVYTITEGINIWFIIQKKNALYMKLLDLVDNNETDKNTSHSYLELYENLLSSKRESAKNVLEIGIGSGKDKNGGSIKLWKDYFENAKIFGLDILGKERVLDELLNDERVILFTSSDAYNEDFFTSNILNSNVKFDFLLDDGPHTLESMKIFIRLYSQVLLDDGILIIEDVQSMDWIEELKNEVPENMKHFIEVYDLRHIKNRWDDIVFVINKNLYKEI